MFERWEATCQSLVLFIFGSFIGKYIFQRIPPLTRSQYKCGLLIAWHCCGKPKRHLTSPVLRSRRWQYGVCLVCRFT